jgi:periplasmic divalent cation tolerance protein
VNVAGLVTSFFRWKGRASKAREALLIAKTRRALFAKLAARVKALHSYEVPEIIAVPLAAGSSGYLRWVGEETG